MVDNFIIEEIDYYDRQVEGLYAPFHKTDTWRINKKYEGFLVCSLIFEGKSINYNYFQKVG